MNGIFNEKKALRFYNAAVSYSPRLSAWVSGVGILLLAMVLAGYGATYYVDFDAGVDSNSGLTQALPFRSLPGMRTASNSGYVSASYGGGTFTTSSKVPAGTTFKIKRGTTWNSSDGGWWQCDSAWYQNGTSVAPITIQADPTWGSGSIVIDGTGVTLPQYRGLLNINRIKYVVVDGVVSSGMVVRNTSYNGIQAYDDTGVNGLTLKNLEVANGPTALVLVYSIDSATPTYMSNVTLDNLLVHDATGTTDSDSCILGIWLNNFVVKNCTAYNSGTGSDGIHIGSSHYGWVLNCTAYNCGEQGIDLSRDGSFKTRDDSYYITVRDCIAHDNKVNDFDHNSGTHHIAWINNFAWKTTSGSLGDPCFNVHEGSAGPNWWINCSSSHSQDGGYFFNWSGNPWSIPSGTYPQTYLNVISSGDSINASASRRGSILIDDDTTGCIATSTVGNSILNTTSTAAGTMYYRGAIYTAANVAGGTGGFSSIGTACLTNLPSWLTPNGSTWNISNETPGAGSVAFNGGAWPFRTSGAGAGSTSLVVTNAYGLAVTNVFRVGDYVQIESAGIAQVTAVTGSGTLTLAAAASWSSAKGVWFNQGGTAPLIGAGFTKALGFTQQPTGVVAGAVITPAVQVTAFSGGAPDTVFTGNVTVAIGSNPGGATLGGTLTKAAFAGIAVFNDLTLNNAGNGYTLTATASGYTSATSAAFNVTPVTPPTPGVPVLQTPANGASGVSLSPTLTWQSSANSTGYDIDVATDAGFTSIVASQVNQTATTFVPTPALSVSTTYYWRVRGRNSAATSAFSGTFSFSTALPSPAVPVLSAPADGATGVALNPTLSWLAAQYASNYRIQVATDSGFVTVIADATTTSLSYAPTLLAATPYYWHVRSQNATANSAYSTTRSFTTSPPPAPAAPTLSSPADTAIDQSISPTLSWNSSATATSYQIQIATDSGFTAIVANVSGITSLSYVAGLLNSTLYYWHVRAANAGGNSAYSTSRSFTTIAAVPVAPSAPVLSSPADLATGINPNPTLVWLASSGATGYRIQIATDAGFVTVISDQSSLTSTSFAPTLANSTQYWWHVNASNTGGTSSYSTPFTFTTAAPPPPPPPASPVLWNPANAATGQPVNVTLSWTGPADATSYHLQVSTVVNFASTVIDNPGVTDQFYLTSLSTGTLYYWRVLASNSGGNSAYTAARTFTTVPAIPAAPSLSSPANAATGQSTSPTLAWLTSPGASSYGLQVATDAGFTSLVVNQSGIATLTYTPTGLATGTTFYWHANAANTGGTSSYSGARTFTTVPTVPAAPTLTSPANTATGIALSPLLTWTSSPGATSYGLQIATDVGFGALVVNLDGISTTSYTPSLSAGTLYYWRVRSANSGGNSSYTASRTFTTVTTTPPVPVLVSPNNNATFVSAAAPVVWAPSTGASSYRLQMSTSVVFATTNIDVSGIAATTYYPPLNTFTPYYWRVSATGTGGTSANSAQRKFTTWFRIKPRGQSNVSPVILTQ